MEIIQNKEFPFILSCLIEIFLTTMEFIILAQKAQNIFLRTFNYKFIKSLYFIDLRITDKPTAQFQKQ